MDKPAFPLNLDPQYYECFDGCSKKDYKQLISGMTLREYAAVAAMQGQLAAQGPEVGEWSEAAFPELARISVAIANALLARLEEEP